MIPLTPTPDHATPIEHRDVLLDGAPWSKEHYRRIKSVQAHHGFLIHGLEEGDAAAKLDKLDKKSYIVNPVVTYLQKHSEYHDHVQAAREAIVDQFEEFASSAVNEIDYTWTLMQHLEEYSLDETVNFNDIFLLFSLRYASDTVAHLTSLARRAEIQAFLDGKGLDPLIKRRLIDELGTMARVARIRSDLGGLNAPQLVDLAHQTHSSEAKRLNYWYRQLQDIQADSRVREKAGTALAELDVHIGASKIAHGML